MAQPDVCCYIIVMTYQQGDLKRYLRAQRKLDGMTPDLPTRDLLTLQRMAFEITSGLLHLHENNYIHRSAPRSNPSWKQSRVARREQIYLCVWFFQRGCLTLCSDLALRNCLLTSDLTVRIGDYGLSHNHYKVYPSVLVLFYFEPDVLVLNGAVQFVQKNAIILTDIANMIWSLTDAHFHIHWKIMIRQLLRFVPSIQIMRFFKNDYAVFVTYVTTLNLI